MDERFKNVENEYFRLKGQLASKHITHEQFETALKDLMLQDGQGRWWMLGVNNAKWYVNDGTSWVESDPAHTLGLSDTKPSAVISRAPLLRQKFILAFIALGLIVFIALLIIAGRLFLAPESPFIQISQAAMPTNNAPATNAAQAQATLTTLAQPTHTSTATQTSLPTSTPTPTPTSTPLPTLTPTLAPTPRPTGNCADPGAQLLFQDGYRPDPYFHIMGTARAQNFQFYLMEFADRTDNPQWRQLRAPVTTQVNNAELAEWVLSTVGGYQWYVRVTVYLNDGTTLASCVRWIQQR